MSSQAYSAPQRLFLNRLKALKEQLAETIEKEILPKLKDANLPAATQEEFKLKLSDLRKTIQEITYLEKRLEQL